MVVRLTMSWSAPSGLVITALVIGGVVLALIVWMIVRRRGNAAVAATPTVVAFRRSTAVAAAPLPPAPARGVSGRERTPADSSNGIMPRRPESAQESVSDRVVHTAPTTDGTLQFLPGRLQIIDGDRSGRDIRFVRTWGEVPEVTFGRVTGPPYRHVQLKSQTVSRQHARLHYVEGRWRLTNLSQTNPVLVNGHALDTAHGQCVLQDGDQIEMGEVIFRFHER